MKKVLVCCTNAVATSTMVAMKVKNRMKEEGVPVEVTTCSILEIDRKIKLFKPDLIISNVGRKANIKAECPIVDGIPVLSGRNAEESWSKIISCLKGE